MLYLKKYYYFIPSFFQSQNTIKTEFHAQHHIKVQIPPTKLHGRLKGCTLKSLLLKPLAKEFR